MNDRGSRHPGKKPEPEALDLHILRLNDAESEVDQAHPQAEEHVSAHENLGEPSRPLFVLSLQERPEPHSQHEGAADDGKVVEIENIPRCEPEARGKRREHGPHRQHKGEIGYCDPAFPHENARSRNGPLSRHAAPRVRFSPFAASCPCTSHGPLRAAHPRCPCPHPRKRSPG